MGVDSSGTATRTFSGPMLAAMLALSGCAAGHYQPFDSAAHLQERIAERVGPEQAQRVAIPYQLDDAVRAELEGRLNPAASERRRSRDIVDFVFGWLDLRYSLIPTRDAVSTFQTREGNCLSFVNLFVGLAREQRLNPFYVEVRDYRRWNYRDGVVISQGHIVAGLYLDGELSTFDFLPYRPKSYRDFRPIDDLQATAHYYNNLGAEALMAGEVPRAEELLEIASSLAPDFDKALNNLGVVYLRQGRLEEAAELYQRGLEHNPDSAPILTNLARAYQRLGREAEAAELLARIEELNETNPFYFVYRGELALSQGKPDEALRFMTRALRQESEVPEVHLGFVKVYLAMGEVRKARHHLERALKLDATNEEARRFAELLAAREAAVAAPEGPR